MYIGDVESVETTWLQEVGLCLHPKTLLVSLFVSFELKGFRY